MNRRNTVNKCIHWFLITVITLAILSGLLFGGSIATEDNKKRSLIKNTYNINPKTIQAGDITVLDSGRSAVALQNYHDGLMAFGSIGKTFRADLSNTNAGMASKIKRIIKPGEIRYPVKKVILEMIEDALEEDRKK